MTVEELEALTYAAPGEECDTFWGSHGCDRPPGHELPHVCGTPDEDDGLCSIHDGENVRYVVGTDDGQWALSENHWPTPTFSNRDRSPSP